MASPVKLSPQVAVQNFKNYEKGKIKAANYSTAKIIAIGTGVFLVGATLITLGALAARGIKFDATLQSISQQRVAGFFLGVGAGTVLGSISLSAISIGDVRKRSYLEEDMRFVNEQLHNLDVEDGQAVSDFLKQFHSKIFTRHRLGNEFSRNQFLRKFGPFIQHLELPREVYVEDRTGGFKKEPFVGIISKCPNLRSVTLSGINKTIIDTLPATLTELKVTSLVGLGQIESLGKFTQLEKLTVLSSVSDDNSTFAQHIEKLNQLAIKKIPSKHLEFTILLNGRESAEILEYSHVKVSVDMWSNGEREFPISLTVKLPATNE